MNTEESHYQAVFKEVNDAVYTTDLLGKFTTVNPAGERMTGYTKKEFLELSVSDVVVPGYMKLVKEMIQQKLSKDIPTIYEIEIRRKDGKQIPVEISSRAIYEAGRAVGILGIARDITERKVLEHQKEIFFSLITHEIKNPLTTIKGYSELLMKYHEKTNEVKPKEYASIIDGQVNKLTVLINDFLDISKMNSGKFTITKEKFDLDALIDDVVSIFNKNESKNRIIIKVKGKNIVHADRNRIEQVLINLIQNAVKYSPQDTNIFVTAKEDKKNVIVSVTDSGAGIEKDNQKNIFELFFRLAHHQQNKIKGHGLGLYICKQIIQGHNGEIWVESDGEGLPAGRQGSSFYFSLPL